MFLVNESNIITKSFYTGFTCDGNLWTFICLSYLRPLYSRVKNVVYRLVDKVGQLFSQLKNVVCRSVEKAEQCSTV